MSRRRSKNNSAVPAPEGDYTVMDDLGRPIDSPMAKVHDADDANDPAILDRQNKAERRRQVADDQVVRDLLSTRDGRDWLYRKLEACHIYDSGTDLGTEDRPSDPYKTYFMNGERNIGHRLLADVQRAAPALYMSMLTEQKQKKDYDVS